MKHIILLFLLIISSFSFSQTITRGPEPGEIYFLSPTHTSDGLYHSTDFGQTAICMDSVSPISSIAADKTPGGVYYFAYPDDLYYSNNYGIQDSWEFKYSGSDLSSMIMSGVEVGHIFSDIYLHSEDFGENFMYHSLNGFFGNLKRAIIDNVQENIGYCSSFKLTVADSIYIFRTDDYFNNLEFIHQLYFHWNEIIPLARGFNTGEVFMFNFTRNQLRASFDYFDNIIHIDTFNIPDFYAVGIEGGNIAGELYLLYAHSNQFQQNRNTYIFHSTDYGVTFDAFHPFAKGNQPVIANFSTINKEVFLLSEVEFDNFSIGNNLEYQWDFENDGIIDSYEEFPMHVYQDTGYYSVKLSVVGQDSINTFIKENYIHVIDTITNSPDLNYQTVNISPNPFSDKISIETNQDFKMIEIFDINGKSHFSKTLLQENKTEIIDLRNLKNGIYILKIKTERQNITKKIIKI